MKYESIGLQLRIKSRIHTSYYFRLLLSMNNSALELTQILIE